MTIKKGGGQASLILNIVLAVVVIGILGVYFLRQYKTWSSKEEQSKWPLNVNPCPDYWYLADDGTCITEDKDNKYSLTDLSGCKINPTKKDKIKYLSTDLREKTTNEKCSWAKKCKIAWDGIRNQC